MTEVEAVVFVIDDDGRFVNHLTTQMTRLSVLHDCARYRVRDEAP